MGGSGAKAVSVEMPTLTGSPKQISWAEEIRNSVLINTDNLVKTAKSELGMYTTGGKKVSKSAADWFRRDVISTLQTVSNASQIIDARKGLTYDSLMRRLGDVQVAIDLDQIKPRKKKK